MYALLNNFVISYIKQFKDITQGKNCYLIDLV